MLLARRPTHRPDQAAGDLFQPVLRRQEAEPPVRDRQHLAVGSVCGIRKARTSVSKCRKRFSVAEMAVLENDKV